MRKKTGIMRKTDGLGRVCLPKELRDSIGINDDTNLDIYVDDDVICLKPSLDQCFCCGNMNKEELVQRENKKTLCINCAIETLDLYESRLEKQENDK